MTVAVIICPSCAGRLQSRKRRRPGKRVRCRKCEQVFAMPVVPRSGPEGPPPQLGIPISAGTLTVLAPPPAPALAPRRLKRTILLVSVVLLPLLGVGVFWLARTLLAPVARAAVPAVADSPDAAPPRPVIDGPAYTLAFKATPDVGQVQTGRTLSRFVRQQTLRDDEGKVLRETTHELSTEVEFTYSVLEAGEGRPRKYRVAYSKATIVSDGKTATLPYQGRTVLYEWNGQGYDLRTEDGAELPDAIRDVFLKKANASLGFDPAAFLLPNKPVRVGECWRLNVDAVADHHRRQGFVVDRDYPEEVQLVRVYEKDNKRFGSFRYREVFEAPDRPGDAIAATTALEAAIDGTSAARTMQSSGRWSGSVVQVVSGNPVTAHLYREMTLTSELSVER